MSQDVLQKNVLKNMFVNMPYKNRLIFLLSLIAVLALLYTGSIIYNSDIGTRHTSFAWLDSKTAEKVNRIAVAAPMVEFDLLKQDNYWYILHNDSIYPARQIRVQDLLNVFVTRSAWPVRSSSASTHERFGLDSQASRITMHAASQSSFAEQSSFASQALIDILVGDDDAMGREAYFRLFGQNEVRSGDNSIKTYLTAAVSNWYNLRLIPESEGGQLDVNSVQRLFVYTPNDSQIFTRRNRGWIIPGIENPDIHGLENYIRTILNTEADSFAQIGFDDNISSDYVNNSSIVLEFGNGRVITIRLSEEDDTGRRLAHVSGSEILNADYIYSIPPWSVNRLFRDILSFQLN